MRHGSLSARLLWLTIGFVMVAEVLIYVPSVARFRQTWLEARIEAANIAALAVVAAPENMVSDELAAELLARVGAKAVALRRPPQRYLLAMGPMPPAVAETYDLRDADAAMLIGDALRTLAMPGPRLVNVVGRAPTAEDAVIEVILDEEPLRQAMYDFSWRILTLSVVISLITAGLVFLTLRWLLVRPMQRLTESIVRFRAAPEDASRVIAPSLRRDEVGRAERELAEMQRELRLALTQKAHLAALGEAVSKISHDLRNMLATAELVSDRLADSNDPQVRSVAPRLVESIGRAIALCTQTLRFGRAEEAPPQPSCFPLRRLVEDVGMALGLPDGRILWRNEAPADLELEADRDQFFRVLLNLGRNAVQAIPAAGEIRIAAARHEGMAILEISDTGGGLSEAAQQHLFQPFRGGRAGGSGLGLAIARELVRAHGGDIALARSGPLGTTFRIDLPQGPRG